METNNKRETEKLIFAIGDTDYEVQSYSGRGMYGKQCVGVSVPRGELLRACMKIALALTEMDERELADTISDEAMSDSLGLGSILYFPFNEWPEESK